MAGKCQQQLVALRGDFYLHIYKGTLMKRITLQPGDQRKHSTQWMSTFTNSNNNLFYFPSDVKPHMEALGFG